MLRRNASRLFTLVHGLLCVSRRRRGSPGRVRYCRPVLQLLEQREMPGETLGGFLLTGLVLPHAAHLGSPTGEAEAAGMALIAPQPASPTRPPAPWEGPATTATFAAATAWPQAPATFAAARPWSGPADAQPSARPLAPGGRAPEGAPGSAGGSAGSGGTAGLPSAFGQASATVFR
jgi:hypothetical protein